MVVRTAQEYGRPDGSHIKFDDNAAVLINNQGRRAGLASLARWAGSCENDSSCGLCHSRQKFSRRRVEKQRERKRMRKIRSGDTVLVTSGRNKGQQGKVRINMIERDRVVIEGVNIVKKHIKRGRARRQASSRWKRRCTSRTSSSFARTASSQPGRYSRRR